jgi:hypothetical protein
MPAATRAMARPPVHAAGLLARILPTVTWLSFAPRPAMSAEILRGDSPSAASLWMRRDSQTPPRGEDKRAHLRPDEQRYDLIPRHRSLPSTAHAPKCRPMPNPNPSPGS